MPKLCSGSFLRTFVLLTNRTEYGSFGMWPTDAHELKERKKERKKFHVCQRERIRTKKNDTHARATVASSLVDCTRTSSSSFARPGFLLLLLLLSLDMMTSEQQQRKVRYFNVVLWLNFFFAFWQRIFFLVFFFSVVFFEFFFFCLGGENTHTL